MYYFVSDSSAVPSDTDVEKDICICKFMVAAHSNLRVQVGVLRQLDNHLFLRLVCPNLMDVDIYWPSQRNESFISLLVCSKCLLGRR